ncbi:MAG TPA: HAMP domain-containing protein, partial [Miltoncostaeaceae bacterium]|nr:HAMP domain-containing protein [Miltoncostaeaceae bacterium]
MNWIRRPLSLQAWLVTAFVAVGVVASLAVALVVLPTLENSIRSDQANREGKRVADAISVTGDLDMQDAHALLDRLAVELGGELRLLSPSGNVIPANVSPQIAYLPEFTATPPGELALTTRSGSRTTVFRNGTAVIWAGSPLRIQGERWAIEAGVPVRGAAGEIAIVRRRVLFAVITVIALASILGLLLAHVLGRRMRGLAGTAATLAGGDLSARAGAVAPRELTSLGDSINTMASRLEALVAETVTDRDRARALIS